MIHILHIDTSSMAGLVALSSNGEIVAIRTNLNQRDHAAFLHPAIEEILLETGLEQRDINAVAVANGPGSYTGLRVGLSSAKGLCYVWQVPLLTLSSLAIMAKAVQLQTSHVIGDNQQACIIPMLDARRMEVFYAAYTHAEHPQLIIEPAAAIVDEAFGKSLPNAERIYFTGDGMNKWQGICNIYKAVFIDLPDTAHAFGLLALEDFRHKKWADIGYSEPFYVKAFYSQAHFSK